MIDNNTPYHIVRDFIVTMGNPISLSIQLQFTGINGLSEVRVLDGLVFQ
jgi:hypothetical protein